MKMKQLLLILAITASICVQSQQVKMAMVINKTSVDQIADDDDKKAAEWFVSYYGPNANIVNVNEITSGDVSLNQFKVVWVPINLENKTGILDSEYLDVNFLNKLKQFHKDGGNLLLTNHSAQLINLIGRINFKPNVIEAGLAIQVDETSTVNPQIVSISNYKFHPIYNGLTSSNQYGYPTFRMSNSGLKEIHNCMWDLSKLGFANDDLFSFEKSTNSRVIGTSGQNTDSLFAGIVEFFPNADYMGRCIVIGTGEYEWNKNDALNLYQSSIQRMTSNALEYLATDFAVYSEPILTSYYSMELNDEKTSVKELISNTDVLVEHSQNVRENVPGVSGNALRFDGFITTINGKLNVDKINNNSFTASIWTAIESYPMMNVNDPDQTFTFLAGNMNVNSGFAFVLNSNGIYGFQCFIDGEKYFCQANEKLTKYQWINLSATVDSIKREVVLMNNGVIVSKQYFRNNITEMGPSDFIIGKNRDNTWLGPFRLNTVNGLIDEIKVYSGVNYEIYKDTKIENTADLSIPTERFKDDAQRPKFHGMPGANWTNEPHGLVNYNGAYHIFFQKNANGPYWGRIHWGHIVSDDLILWKEVKTAIDPETFYDIKGAWSGCVYSDPELTNNEPHIFYTSVDYAKATIAEAMPMDDSLLNWTKNSLNPVINGKPVGLDEDFRDPYVFKANGENYMVVGSRKNGKGVATLHKYDRISKSWSNDGKIFFQSPSSIYGVFWEMPFVVPFDNGKFMFGTTQLGGQNGVETLYWIGTINQDGTFKPDVSVPKELELGNMSKQGYGLLSPSVMKKDGKTIAIGIVPDKLDINYNRLLGWAHLFSLPREWELINNELIQKPYSGLTQMRSKTAKFELTNTELNNSIQTMDSISGTAAEMVGQFELTSTTNKVGFNVRKSGSNLIKIYYDKVTNEIVVDTRNSRKWMNDVGIYDGLYKTALPEILNNGDLLKLHIFIDGSIMDIFINDKWAFSIRIFPFKNDAVNNEVFVEGNVKVKSINGWKLEPEGQLDRIEKPEINKVKLWLSEGRLRIEGLTDKYSISIYNALGKKILYTNDFLELSRINLLKGQIYLFLVENEGEFSVHKIIP